MHVSVRMYAYEGGGTTGGMGGGGRGGGMASAPECQKLAKQQYNINKRIDKSIYK